MIAPGLHIGAVMGSGIYIAMYSETNLYAENPIVFVVLFGLMATKVTNKLIVSHGSETCSYSCVMLISTVSFRAKGFEPLIFEERISEHSLLGLNSVDCREKPSLFAKLGFMRRECKAKRFAIGTRFDVDFI